MTIKKNFVELVELLTLNKDKKVEDILDQVLELSTSKVRESVYKLDDDGNVTHVFCYYHKEWEDISTHEYGSKKSAKHGINNMCKVGVNSWTKAQSDFKKSKLELLEKLMNDEITKEELDEKILELEVIKDTIIPLES